MYLTVEIIAWYRYRAMKGKTTCPQCNHTFVVDVPESADKYDTTCEKCGHEFIIRPSGSEAKRIDSDWEEHGEPRKTVLSALKPHTGKPFVASFLLLAVGILGLFNAFFEYNGDELVPYLTSELVSIGHVELSIVLIVFSVVAIIGSVVTFKRKFFKLAVICTIIGLFSFGFLAGMIVGIAALVFIMMSRDEFENGTKGRMF